MKDYVIFTDSSCDLSEESLKERGVIALPLSFRFDGEEYSNYGMESSEFYNNMRTGMIARTSAVNPESFKAAFKEVLDDGKDVLYIGFSSGLSTTYNSSTIAIRELKEDYPDSKIYAVDTLAASLGVAMIIDLVLDKKSEGADIDEAKKLAESIKMSVAHRFTVDDLTYLKRGGRISATTALVGNLLGIKPVMHVDNDGHLVACGKVRGRHASIVSLCDTIGLYAKEGTRVYISHGDCLSDAEKLSKMIEEKYGYKTGVISNVGPVIGAHSGPGTLALFFLATER